MRGMACVAVVVSLVGMQARIVRGQSGGATAGEPLQLAVLQREAEQADARAREIELLEAQAGLRMRNIEIERRPSLSALGQSQYQSDVPTAPFNLPNGDPAFASPKFTYDASLRVEQRLYDPALAPRLALARADLAESQARVRSTLYGLRHEVNDSFFAAAMLQEQLGALAAAIGELEVRLREVSAAVREGVALPGDAAAVEATLLQQRLRADELGAGRSAALARLSILVRHPIAGDTPMALPDLAEPVVRARQALDRVRARPEYAQFDRSRDRAARQQVLAAAADRPQASAFGRVGFGQPGLNFVNDRGESYALAGVQVQWRAWTWGTSAREREALALQQTIVSAEENAFTSGLRRAVESDLAAIERLEVATTTDERIVALRESVDRSARLRLREGVTTASEYLDRNTEWVSAQFDRARHRVELAQAQARLLTTLGLEVR